METRPFRFTPSILLLLGVCVAYCTSGPSATTPIVAQSIRNARVKPDHPGGKGHTRKAAKDSLKLLTNNYHTVHFPDANHPPTEEDPRAYYIDRKSIEDILKQKGCIGIRIYPAYKSSTAPYGPRLLVVGVEKGVGAVPFKDQIATYEDKATLQPKECTVIETDDKCPDNCDPNSY